MTEQLDQDAEDAEFQKVTEYYRAGILSTLDALDGLFEKLPPIPTWHAPCVPIILTVSACGCTLGAMAVSKKMVRDRRALAQLLRAAADEALSGEPEYVDDDGMTSEHPPGHA